MTVAQHTAEVKTGTSGARVSRRTVAENTTGVRVQFAGTFQLPVKINISAELALGCHDPVADTHRLMNDRRRRRSPDADADTEVPI